MADINYKNKQSNIGKKIAGSILAILTLVAPIIFKPRAITIIDPVAEISLIAPVKIPLKALAQSSIVPWYRNKGIMESIAPIPPKAEE